MVINGPSLAIARHALSTKCVHCVHNDDGLRRDHLVVNVPIGTRDLSF